ncbi:MAG: sel1 repeat family protein [archaeon]|nr:sel1 repeat family protein [archaeon]
MAFLDSITGKDGNTELGQAYGTYSEGGFVASLDAFSSIDLPEAEYCAAFHYLNGKGVKKDVKKAFSMFVSSMEHGYVPALSEVAQCYGYGIGVKVDDGKAFELFSKAAEEGDPYGMSMISMMYGNGDGVKRDKKKAQEWADRCEEAGDIDTIEEIGMNHLVSGNHILARMYLMRSAVMGSPISAKALACMYSFGEGVAQDDDEASDWEDTADTNGWDEVTLEDLDGCEDWFGKFIDLEDLAEEED